MVNISEIHDTIKNINVGCLHSIGLVQITAAKIFPSAPNDDKNYWVNTNNFVTNTTVEPFYNEQNFFWKGVRYIENLTLSRRENGSGKN